MGYLEGAGLITRPIFLRMWNVRLYLEQLSKRETRLTAERRQYGRDDIMQTLEQFRREGIKPGDRDGLGRWALSIPFEDFERLCLKYPELASKDPQTKSAAYKRFMRSDASKPYRMG